MFLRDTEATYEPIFNVFTGSSSFDGRTAITYLADPNLHHLSYMHSRRHPFGLPS